MNDKVYNVLFLCTDNSARSFVFPVCDNAAGEQCPVWPDQPMTVHLGVRDPAAVKGSDDTKMRAFKDAAATLRKRIELFKSLPLVSLDRVAIKKEITDIGKSAP
ncbi:hypothetical protein [Paraburkholderia diazotrophica]|uniref:hypothetical protein n=1 Tax=Paraburkholderia diazotrophica TaxID=667676 RepID=UPI00317D97D4